MNDGSPSLLVSVRSAAEAVSAVHGGASIIDIKEPSRGPLGMADVSVWHDVRSVVPAEIPVSVALGELTDWTDHSSPPQSDFEGISFRKIGLAHVSAHWIEQWADLRKRMGVGPKWIAVIYSDWASANAPEPDAIIDEAVSAGCAGVLIDTWNKLESPGLDPSWRHRIERIKKEIGLVALAGSLTETRIRSMQPFAPDYFAVRGAACRNADRSGQIDPARVARLVQACRAENQLVTH